MLVAETFHGYIETTQDVLLIFEGCRRGLLPRVCRRLQEKERKMIQSGSVFVFDERESGIKRWTDGYVWSPSRILGNFLIYRELDKRNTTANKRGSYSSATPSAGEEDSTNNSRQRSYSADQSSAVAAASTGGRHQQQQQRNRQLVGSLSDSYKFRKDGLIKKTMSIVVNGVSQHLISYYNPQDVIGNRLRTPSSVPELASLEISPELLARQNFRIPPMVESTFDPADPGVGIGTGGCSTMSAGGDNNGGGPVYAYNNRRSSHPLRSMSLSSLRGPEPSHHPYHSTSRPPLDPTGLMWHSAEAPKHPYAMMYNSNGQQPSPAAQMTSPTSSPDSPAPSYLANHQEHHHQHHYSVSSTPSSRGGIATVDPYNRPSNDTLQQQQQHQDQRQPQPNDYMANLYHHQRPQQQPSEQPHKGIDQLLNPVHPLTTSSASSPQQQQQSFLSTAATTASSSNNHHVSKQTADSLAVPRQQPEPRSLTDTYGMMQHHHHHHTPSHNVIHSFNPQQDGQDMAGPLMLK